uniref:Uncharacterized protein n=1 Tax=Hyaloperonospora arabidopsidis (strain Emoy2) TaxID=559515 RepID=M4BTJ4_HYAAE
MNKKQMASQELPQRKKLRVRATAATVSYNYGSEQQESDMVETEREGGREEEDEDEDEEGEGEEEGGRESADRTDPSSRGAARRQTKLMDLEQHVRNLERDNLHLKQALLQGTNGAGQTVSGAAATLSQLAGRRDAPPAFDAMDVRVSANATAQRLLAERTKVVTEMVKQLNAAYLSLSDASRVWHKDCRIGVGVYEWDAFGRLETISLWNMIRSVFTNICVDIVELRPHVADGEMILTKWRVQGEIASAESLETVCASEDCPATMRVALLAIKSSDLTFTVTTYVVFQDLQIAEQYHSWDQVGIFKRLFGGEIPLTVRDMLVIDEDTVADRKQPLDV